jgi:DNA-directed RNA polymerase specialized sigma24 family protein
MDKDECRQKAVFKVFRWFPKVRDRLLFEPDDRISKILFWALVKTMKRLIVDESRRVARQKTSSLETGGSGDDGDTNAEGAALVQRAKEVFRATQSREAEEETKREQRQRFRYAMGELQRKNPIRHQIVSHKLEEVSDREIARLMGLPEQEIKDQWGLAVKQLRYYLKTKYPPGILP